MKSLTLLSFVTQSLMLEGTLSMHFPLVLAGFPTHQSHRQILPFYLRCWLLHFPESLPSSCPSSVTQNLLRLSPPPQTTSYQPSVLECQNSFQFKKKHICGSSHKLARCSLSVFLQQAAGETWTQWNSSCSPCALVSKVPLLQQSLEAAWTISHHKGALDIC